MKQKLRRITLVLSGILLISAFGAMTVLSTGMVMNFQDEIDQEKEEIKKRIGFSYKELDKIMDSREEYNADGHWFDEKGSKYEDDVINVSHNLRNNLQSVEYIYGKEVSEKIEQISDDVESGINNKEFRKIRKAYKEIETVKNTISEDEG